MSKYPSRAEWLGLSLFCFLNGLLWALLLPFVFVVTFGALIYIFWDLVFLAELAVLSIPAAFSTLWFWSGYRLWKEKPGAVRTLKLICGIRIVVLWFLIDRFLRTAALNPAQSKGVYKACEVFLALLFLSLIALIYSSLRFRAANPSLSAAVKQ